MVAEYKPKGNAYFNEVRFQKQIKKELRLAPELP